MRADAVSLEEERLKNVSDIEDYPSLHERHRIFPAVFEGKHYQKVFDIAAGVGVVAKRIQDGSDAEVVCNDLCPKCLSVMGRAGLNTVSFNIDDDTQAYPIESENFDAVVALATIEHLINLDHFLGEINRILKENGRLYISAPNYSGLTYLLPFLFTGKTFHDPLSEQERYEFYAHVRYFTYRSLIDVVQKHNFIAEEVYLPIPDSSSKYLALKQKSKIKAQTARCAMKALYLLFSPRWAAEPVVCLRKGVARNTEGIKKIVM
jgi:SAM-dependent methyltransferase